MLYNIQDYENYWIIYNIRNTVFDTDIEEFPLKRKFTSLYFLQSIYDKGKYRN
jgi:hypothetical protein